MPNRGEREKSAIRLVWTRVRSGSSNRGVVMPVGVEPGRTARFDGRFRTPSGNVVAIRHGPNVLPAIAEPMRTNGRPRRRARTGPGSKPPSVVRGTSRLRPRIGQFRSSLPWDAGPYHPIPSSFLPRRANAHGERQYFGSRCPSAGRADHEAVAGSLNDVGVDCFAAVEGHDAPHLREQAQSAGSRTV